MPFPNHAEKYGSPSVVTPTESTDYQTGASGGRSLPEAVVLCYSGGLMERVVESHPGEMLPRPFGSLYSLADTDHTVGVMGNFGMGAPTTAMVMEELLADGVDTVLTVGKAGSLTDDIDVGEFVVTDRAIRDEGTSHHYLESEADARATDRVVDALTSHLAAADESYHVGPTWTTDAIYRETVAEVERYAEEGVLTVDMEAATVFAVGEYRDVDVGGLFVVSDYLDTSGWEPQFRQSATHEYDAVRLAVDLLAEWVR